MNEREILEQIDKIEHQLKVIRALIGVPTPTMLKTPTTPPVQATLPIGYESTEMIAISQLYPGLEDIELIAHVVSITPTTPFNRSTGGTGTLRRVFIKDETDQMAVLLWNDQCGIPDSIGLNPNDRVHVHAQKITKSPKGETEITLGHSGYIRKV